MLFKLDIRNNRKIRVIVPHTQFHRIGALHFRGGHNNQTGNFAGNFLFDRCDDLLHYSIFKGKLKAELAEMVEAGETGEFSKDFGFNQPVGWSSTDDIRNYQPEDLEEFKPSQRGKALRVKTDRSKLLAPLTNRITVVYELRELDHYEPLCFINSLYPGKDIGELDGNVTEREKIVFFDWKHRGASTYN